MSVYLGMVVNGKMRVTEIGGRIKNLRKINHYTREELAEIAGISPKFLYEIESGRKGFSAETLVKISMSLSVSCDYIMFGENGTKRIEELIDILLQFDNGQIGRLKSIIEAIRELSQM